MNIIPYGYGDEYGDDYGAGKRGTPKWKAGGIAAEKRKMDGLARHFARRAKQAASRKHPVHAAAYTALAKVAKTESDRLNKLKALSGDDFSDLVLGDDLGDAELGMLGIPALPINPWLALGLGVGAGFLLKGMMKGK